MPVSKPLGESGASIGNLNANNSFLRMFLLESSHRPAQVRRAGGGHRLLSQDVQLTVAIMPGGTPVAVGGSTETRSRDENGARRAERELAYVSFLRRLTTSSAGLSVGTGTQPMPPVERYGDAPLDARRVLDDRQLLIGAVPGPTAGLLRSLTPQVLSTMAGEIGNLAAAVGKLEGVFGTLAKRETFAAVRASSSSPLYVAAEAGPGAAPGTSTVEVVQAARGHSIRGDEIADGALGLSGSFSLNGVDVAVDATDSLPGLAAKINVGEDTDGDGELDAEEDADGDYQLSGGTDRHGVRATFFEGRLTLTRVDSYAGEIALDDPDGILRELGLLELDGSGQPVFKDELSTPQGAIIRVDGREFRSDDNVFADAIAGVTLTLGGEPGDGVTVTVERTGEDATDALEAALGEFNQAVRTMNSALSSNGGLLSRDPAATRVRQGLVGALLAPVSGLAADLDEAAEAGVERARRARAIFSEAQLDSAARNERAGAGGYNAVRRAEDPPSVYNALDELGILASEDDTFRLDRELFGRVLASRPEEVADLFSGAGEGIAARVLARVEGAVGSTGLLTLRQVTLASLADAGLNEEWAGLADSGRGRMLLAALHKAG